MPNHPSFFDLIIAHRHGSLKTVKLHEQTEVRMSFGAKLRDTIKLPSFTIADIYADRFFVNYLVMPVGVAFDYLRSFPFITGRNNETDDDFYNDYLATKVELVDRSQLPPRQNARLGKDPHFRNGPLYLATIYHDKPKGVLKERQVFLNQQTLTLMNIAHPKPGKPVGDGLSLLLNNVIHFTINGQYWGWSRPRARAVDINSAGEDLLKRVTAKLKDPSTLIERSPLPFFAASLKEACI